MDKDKVMELCDDLAYDLYGAEDYYDLAPELQDKVFALAQDEYISGMEYAADLMCDR